MATTDVYILKSKNNFFLTSIKKEVEYNGKIECSIYCRAMPYDDKERVNDADYVNSMKSKPCLTLSLSLDVNTGKSTDSESYLNYIEYIPECAINGELKRGGGMRELVTCHFALCSELFGVTQYNLLDMSSVDCKGLSLGLRDYGMLVQGKTWYQRILNAKVLLDEDFGELEKYPVKLRQTFSYEDSELLKDSMIESEISMEDRKKYADILTDSAEEGYTWQYTLSRIDANKSGCSFFMSAVVDAILLTLGLERVYDYKVMYDDFIKDSLIAYSKIE